MLQSPFPNLPVAANVTPFPISVAARDSGFVCRLRGASPRVFHSGWGAGASFVCGLPQKKSRSSAIAIAAMSDQSPGAMTRCENQSASRNARSTTAGGRLTRLWSPLVALGCLFQGSQRRAFSLWGIASHGIRPIRSTLRLLATGHASATYSGQRLFAVSLFL